MSIVMLGIPTMMQSDSDAMEKNIDQEAIFAASAKMLQVMTYQWDENSIDPVLLAEGTATTARVLDVPNGSPNFLRVAGTPRRIGHVNAATHRHLFENATNATAIGSDIANPVEGIDDRGAANVAMDNPLAGASGYKYLYQSQITVSNVSDRSGVVIATGAAQDINFTSVNPYANNNGVFDIVSLGNAAANASNLRMIQVTVQHDQNNDGNFADAEDVVVLRSFVANIGEYEIYKRRY